MQATKVVNDFTREVVRLVQHNLEVLLLLGSRMRVTATIFSDYDFVCVLKRSNVPEAVFNAFKPQKLNYELLGNTDHHMHWHIFPRHDDDPLPNRTVWNIEKEVRNAESAKPDHILLQTLKEKLKDSLEIMIKRAP